MISIDVLSNTEDYFYSTVNFPPTDNIIHPYIAYEGDQ